jgi:hypothetical protein
MMKQLLSIMLVFALASFTSPGRQSTDVRQAVKTQTPVNSTVWLANYSGAANDMVITIGSTSFNTTYFDPSWGFAQETVGYFPESNYYLQIAKITPDAVPRRVYIEDPYYQDQSGYYWSTGDFTGSINVNPTFNYISVLFQ